MRLKTFMRRIRHATLEDVEKHYGPLSVREEDITTWAACHAALLAIKHYQPNIEEELKAGS